MSGREKQLISGGGSRQIIVYSYYTQTIISIESLDGMMMGTFACARAEKNNLFFMQNICILVTQIGFIPHCTIYIPFKILLSAMKPTVLALVSLTLQI